MWYTPICTGRERAGDMLEGEREGRLVRGGCAAAGEVPGILAREEAPPSSTSGTPSGASTSGVCMLALRDSVSVSLHCLVCA
jgi:hypothetical protein